MFKKNNFFFSDILFLAAASLLFFFATCDMTYIGEYSPTSTEDPPPGFDLVNYKDTLPPIIKKGSSFWIDGDHIVSDDTMPEELYPITSCFLYLYTYRLDNVVHYDYSSQPPLYNPQKNGYYLDTETHSKRALFKMIYLYSEEERLFLFKSVIDSSWGHYVHYAIDHYDFSFDSSYVYRAITGNTNTENNNYSNWQTITLEPGLYIIKLSGGGGGQGGQSYFTDTNGIADGGAGGDGGIVTEIISFETPVTLVAYAGDAGQPAIATEHSVVSYTEIQYLNGSLPYAYGAEGGSTSGTFPATLSASYTQNIGRSGNGGGGGGGSFLFDPDTFYFLCSGGGGGGSGASFCAQGKAGFRGGIIGPGIPNTGSVNHDYASPYFYTVYEEYTSVNIPIHIYNSGLFPSYSNTINLFANNSHGVDGVLSPPFTATRTVTNITTVLISYNTGGISLPSNTTYFSHTPATTSFDVTNTWAPAIEGTPGFPGGNNRLPKRGGGAKSGEPGYIHIYKLD